MKNVGIYIKLIIIAAILIVINIIAGYVHSYIDLTEEKRFTLAESTTNLLYEVEDRIIIKVLLEGKFPASFKRLQQATREMVGEFRDENSDIDYVFEDPTDGDMDNVNNRIRSLAELGVVGRSLTYFEGKEKVQKLVFPYALVQYGDREVIVNLLETASGPEDEESMLNKSVSLLEYKLANAIQKITARNQGNIVFTSGQGELEPKYRTSLKNELSRFYNIGDLPLDSITSIGQEADLVIVARPTKEFSLKNQFKLDQYVMNGGKIIWLIDKMDAHLDSIQKYKFYVPKEYPLGLDDMWFKYGARIQPNFVLDLQSTAIPQVIGQSGGRPQTQLFPWFYHPLVAPASTHPIVKNLDRVNMYWPSTIDTIQTKTHVQKTVLLASSQYSRYQMNPVRLNFEILKVEPDPSKFNKGRQPVALMLEGQFPSLFENRVDESFKKTLESINQPFRAVSVPTKQLIVSDSDFAANWFNERTQESYPMGYNPYLPQGQNIFQGNQDFMINTIEYMISEGGVLEARNREVKLRLLNGPKVREEQTIWQLINIGLPLLFIILFGLVYNYLRRRKYSKN
ncbi:gliding motility-associated ABC transporter substrate-binding protein GldG [Saprospiraceae bacterium]|nr:gliding motility-associated ABC transporter substrate-binding protein GldG [Saprospiraceae bacterium]MDA9263659.1 gliding motility-associated ABC transporter substrate-binding protein GldG [Saprospiraceae bacterium]MDA9299368.1 gliding motility-associated ABC transporter substrate-binding protein GldG [Saprospiraceae bacterium]MDA9332566.1 gliding motility-associated ABC transporter substrate-binding protein GldG [Saprospiraceae bacterium]MDC1305455.1 gliding motility-associated ABC transpor